VHEPLEWSFNSSVCRKITAIIIVLHAFASTNDIIPAAGNLSAGGIVEEVGKGNSLKAYCASKNNLGKVNYAITLQTLKYKDMTRLRSTRTIYLLPAC